MVKLSLNFLRRSKKTEPPLVELFNSEGVAFSQNNLPTTYKKTVLTHQEQQDTYIKTLKTYGWRRTANGN